MNFFSSKNRSLLIFGFLFLITQMLFINCSGGGFKSIGGIAVSEQSTQNSSSQNSPPPTPQSTPIPTGPDLLFFDNFDYDVSRSGINAEIPFRAHGWSDVKAINSYYQRGSGYIFTQIDSILSSRVAVMESRPSISANIPGFPNGQTAYHLQIGGEAAPLTTIPANVWFQFWTYATPDSRFAIRDKTLYPCRGPYPCANGQGGWLFMWGAYGFETESAPPGGRYLALLGEYADNRNDIEYPTNARKLYQNLSRTPLLAGRWYQIRLHMDVSQAQGAYEAWIRERGQVSWLKVSEWIGGVTPNFYWPIPEAERVGMRALSTPTTVNGGPGDSTTFMDDFAMVRSVNSLPQ